MVLQELGEKILGTLSSLNKAKVIDDEFFKKYKIDMTNALRSADVSNQIVFQFLGALNQIKLADIPQGVSQKKYIERQTLKELVKLVDPGVEAYKPTKGQPNVYMFVGLQGSGKTTTCTKLGFYYKKRGFKVGLVGADTFRAGAREQLMQNAQSVGLPYYVDLIQQDPISVAIAGVQKFKRERYDIIIVDTSGKHAQEEALFKEMEEMQSAIKPDEIIFVLDGNIGQSAYQQAQGFSDAVDIGSIILTKLDSGTKGGGAMSAVAATKCPIAFYGTGEEMDQLEIFDPNSFISRILGYADPAAVINKLEELDMEKQADLTKRIMQGQYGFREMYEQYEMILSMGNITDFIGKLGVGDLLPKGLKNEDITTTLRKYLIVIDSMSDKEVDDPSLFKEKNRITRISRGTGMNKTVIENVITEQKKFAKAFAQISKNKMFKQMLANPEAMSEKSMMAQAQQMMKSMNPNMLKQLQSGGLANVMKSMMGGMGGMGRR